MSRSAREPLRFGWRLVISLAAVAAVLVTIASREAPASAFVSAVARSSPVDSLLVTEREYTGWKYFHVYCFRCHGTDAFGGQLAPDLRHSVGPEGSIKHDDFVLTVKEGRLAKGMPSWKTMLSDEQIEGLFDYVKARSEGRLAPGRPHTAATKP
jgi:mono/diheme cytochrome c family protein